MTEELISNEDRLLFNKIAADIKNNPDKYRVAGQWLDAYCSEKSFRQRIEKKLKTYEKAFETDGVPLKREIQLLRFMLENEAYQTLDLLNKVQVDIEDTRDSEVQMAHLKAFILVMKKAETLSMYLWYDTIDYLTRDFPNAPFLSSQDARCVLLMTWIMTDPDANSSGLNITKFKNMPWEERKRLSSLTFFNTLVGLPDPFREGKHNLWINAVQIAGQEIQGEPKRLPNSENWKIPGTKNVIISEIKKEMGHTDVLANAIDNVLKKHPNLEYPSVRAIRQEYTRTTKKKKR